VNQMRKYASVASCCMKTLVTPRTLRKEVYLNKSIENCFNLEDIFLFLCMLYALN